VIIPSGSITPSFASDLSVLLLASGERLTEVTVRGRERGGTFVFFVVVGVSEKACLHDGLRRQKKLSKF